MDRLTTADSWPSSAGCLARGDHADSTGPPREISAPASTVVLSTRGTLQLSLTMFYVTGHTSRAITRGADRPGYFVSSDVNETSVTSGRLRALRARRCDAGLSDDGAVVVGQ